MDKIGIDSDRTYGGDRDAGAPLLLTVDEAARALRMSRSRVYELMQRGEIPGVVHIGRSVRISRAELEAWVSQQVRAQAIA